MRPIIALPSAAAAAAAVVYHCCKVNQFLVVQTLIVGVVVCPCIVVVLPRTRGGTHTPNGDSSLQVARGQRGVGLQEADAIHLRATHGCVRAAFSVFVWCRTVVQRFSLLLLLLLLSLFIIFRSPTIKTQPVVGNPGVHNDKNETLAHPGRETHTYTHGQYKNECTFVHEAREAGTRVGKNAAITLSVPFLENSIFSTSSRDREKRDTFCLLNMREHVVGRASSCLCVYSGYGSVAYRR